MDVKENLERMLSFARVGHVHCLKYKKMLTEREIRKKKCYERGDLPSGNCNSVIYTGECERE